ncbi:MAG TPA: hypothetical protein VFC93_10370 [Chloroflexota bacterium]|nr:hypothetical protein [Chloroflexota bacterium]
MPLGQPVELLVSRRRDATYAVPAAYEGDFIPGTSEPPRRLTDEERARAQRAGQLVADALAGVQVDELQLNDAVELLHRLAGLSEGEPRFRLRDGRVVSGERLAYRAALG